MGFIDLAKENGAVWSNRPPESYGSIWVAIEALLGAIYQVFWFACFGFFVSH